MRRQLSHATDVDYVTSSVFAALCDAVCLLGLATKSQIHRSRFHAVALFFFAVPI